jgi:hypothetical protein
LLEAILETWGPNQQVATNSNKGKKFVEALDSEEGLVLEKRRLQYLETLGSSCINIQPNVPYEIFHGIDLSEEAFD